MRIVIIGATGHVGGYLVPRLVAAGHDVIAVSCGIQKPYRSDPAWEQVEAVSLDRAQGDADGTFAAQIAALGADVAIDMVCFTRDSAAQLVEALRGRVAQLISCGTIWTHGPAAEVPVAEDEAHEATGEYGIGKLEIEELLLAESARPGGLPSTVLHPGHITGPGWHVINPAGNLDPDVWHRLAVGAEVLLPNFGLETVHHVHAADVAQAFHLAVDNRDAAVGQSFHVVSERAITLRGFATAVAAWFGRTSDLRFVPFDEFARATDPAHAAATREHISRSPSMSIEKARRALGYEPAYTSLEAAAEALRWLSEHGEADLGGAQVPAA